MTCCASAGTVMVTPSSRTFLFQVWISENQLSGGGLVVPRRKAADEEVVNGLGGGQVGVEPDLVAGLEIGNLGDGQGFARAGDVDIDLGAGEVEAGGVGGVEQGATRRAAARVPARRKGRKTFAIIPF